MKRRRSETGRIIKVHLVRSAVHRRHVVGLQVKGSGVVRSQIWADDRPPTGSSSQPASQPRPTMLCIAHFQVVGDDDCKYANDD